MKISIENWDAALCWTEFITWTGQLISIKVIYFNKSLQVLIVKVTKKHAQNPKAW